MLHAPVILWGEEEGKNSAPHRVQQKLTQLYTSSHTEKRMQTVEKKFHSALKMFLQAFLVVTNAVSKKIFLD